MTFNRTRQRKRGVYYRQEFRRRGQNSETPRQKLFFIIVAAIDSEFYISESNVSLYEFSPALILSWQFVCDHSMLVIRPESGD